MDFWSFLSNEIIWIIWKFRNDNIFSGRARTLTESLRRLIFYDIDM